MQLRALGTAMAVLVLVGCGGDGGDLVGGGTIDADTRAGESADAEAYVEAVAESLVADDADVPLDERSATCMAIAIIDLIDAGALGEAGISPEDLVEADSLGEVDVDLPDGAASELAAGMAECHLAEPIQEALVEELGADVDGGLSSDAIRCLEQAVDDQAVGVAMAAALIEGTDESAEALAIDAIVGCPEAMTEVFVAEASSPVTPADEACIHDVIEANPDLMRSAIVDEDSTATQELGTLILDACPSFTG